MAPDTSVGSEHPPGKRVTTREMIPREFLRIIAIWSLIPSYLVAGGFVGYLLDQWLDLFPYLTGAGLLLALIASVRDMYRLRESM